MKSFAERVNERIEELETRVCLGIDPRPEAHPFTHPDNYEDPAQAAKAVVQYFEAIMELTSDVVACYKIQSAFFEAMGVPGLIAMAQLLADAKTLDVPMILDAKRGDIGSTAQAYASAYLGDSVFATDALTVSPFLGVDSIEPFVSQAKAHDKGIFVLVKTSNPGSGDFQDLPLASGETLYEYIAQSINLLAEQDIDSYGYSPIGAVVGATYPEELQALRRQLPHSLLLVPGYGAQGAGAGHVAHAFDGEGLGAIVSSSRGLTYLSQNMDFPEKSHEATLLMRDDINAALDRR